MKTIPADLVPVLAALFAYSFGPIDRKFAGLTEKEKEVFGDEATFNRLLAWADNPTTDTRADTALVLVEDFGEKWGGDTFYEPDRETLWAWIRSVNSALGGQW